MFRRAFSALYDNAALLLTLTMLVWAGNAIAGKFAVGHISPLLLVCLRWIVAATLLVIVARRHLLSDLSAIRANLIYLFAGGAVGYALFNGLLYLALQYTTAITASILQAGIPLFIFILNFAVFRTRPLWVQVAGYSLTLAGVLIAVTRGDVVQLAGFDVGRGELILLGAVIAYASYSVALRAKPQMHWLSLLASFSIAAALVSTMFALYEATTDSFLWPRTLTGWSVVFYTAIFPSIVGQGSFIRGNELLGGNTAGLFLNLVPIFAAFLAVLMLGEQFRLYHAAALVLVVGGIVLAQRFGTRAR